VLGKADRLEYSTDMPEPIRVLLVDDSALVLHGLTAILEESPNLVIAGTARTYEEAITAVRQCQPKVVLLDVRVGVASGIDLCETISARFPPTAVLFLTDYHDQALLRAAIHAGAQGYVLKSGSGVDLAKSVEIVAEGKAVIDSALVSHVITWIRDRAQASRPQSIEDCSKADVEVLSLIAAGKSNKEIAQELQATQTKIASRIQAIYKRLKISRRSEATSCFVRWRERLPRSGQNGTAVSQRSTAYHRDGNGCGRRH
jgi:two-component system, NarL family, response regulator DevR